MYTLENAKSDIQQALELGLCDVTEVHQLNTHDDLTLLTKERFILAKRVWCSLYEDLSAEEVRLKMCEYESLPSKFVLLTGLNPTYWIDTAEELYKIVSESWEA